MQFYNMFNNNIDTRFQDIQLYKKKNHKPNGMKENNVLR